MVVPGATTGVGVIAGVVIGAAGCLMAGPVAVIAPIGIFFWLAAAAAAGSLRPPVVPMLSKFTRPLLHRSFVAGFAGSAGFASSKSPKNSDPDPAAGVVCAVVCTGIGAWPNPVKKSD
jgi:hypothetical protein